MVWRGRTSTQDRIFAALPYMFPALVAVVLAASLIYRVPLLSVLLSPLLLLADRLSLFTMGPLALIPFFVLYLAVIRNQQVHRFIRYNAAMAILVDIALTLASILFTLLMQVFGSIGGIGFLISQALMPLIGAAALVFCGYAIYQTLMGKNAEAPGLSTSAYALSGDRY